MLLCDLRSDTLTRPTLGMRAAMAAAEVGDDVYGEDPTVRKLEEVVADLLGKEAALFVPTGTMANQIALLVHTRPGDDVIVGEGSHCVWYESGAGAAWAGVQFSIAGRGGLFTGEQLQEALKPPLYVFPRSSLVVVENTHNRAGGRVFPQRDVLEIAEVARRHELALHLDGARLWNASVASNVEVRELAAPFHTASVCFSKGLGAPVGSAFVGSKPQVKAAHRFRKMLGGGMRQVGIMAAGALYALEHHRQRLHEDHASARLLAERLQGATGIEVPEHAAETNMVQFSVSHVTAQQLVERAAAHGVLLNATGPKQVRAVTHLDVDRERISLAASTLRELAKG